MKKNCGVTAFDGTDYRIRIASNQPTSSQADALLHEWAHVSAIEEAYKHDASWGEMYTKIYRAWENDFTTGETA